MTPRKVKIEPVIEREGVFEVPTKTTNKAIVVEVGEGCEVKIGDKVLIKTTSLTRFNNEDGVYLLIFENEIQAII